MVRKWPIPNSWKCIFMLYWNFTTHGEKNQWQETGLVDDSSFFPSSGNPQFCFHFRKMLADLAHVYLLHKAKCLLFPSSKFWVQALQWIQTWPRLTPLSCAMCTLYCSVYIELLNGRDFRVRQMSPGLIDMTHRHPLIDWIFILYNRTWKIRSNQVFAISFQDVTFDFLFWPKADHFGLLHFDSSYSQAKTTTIRNVLYTKYFHIDYAVRYQGNDHWGALWTVWLG